MCTPDFTNWFQKGKITLVQVPRLVVHQNAKPDLLTGFHL